MRSRRSMKLPVMWDDAPEVRRIAGELIDQYHGHLRGQPLRYLFRSTATRGRDGSSRKSRIITKGALDVALSADPGLKGQERYYVLEFAKSLWSRMSPDEKRAEVDACLSRLTPGKNSLQVVELGIGGLVPLINRHGLFDESLRSLAKSCVSRQSELEFEAEAQSQDQDEQADQALAGAAAAVPAGDR